MGPPVDAHDVNKKYTCAFPIVKFTKQKQMINLFKLSKQLDREKELMQRHRGDCSPFIPLLMMILDQVSSHTFWRWYIPSRTQKTAFQ